MDVNQKNMQTEPPDKGKDLVITPLPPTSDDDMDGTLFRGYSDEDITDQNQQNRKRAQSKKLTENNTKRTKPTHDKKLPTPSNMNTQTQPGLNQITITQTSEKNPLTQPTTSSQTPQPTTNTNPQSNMTKGNVVYIRNNAYNVLFIEPISIKDEVKILEPMEVGKFLHDTKLDQFAELKKAGQYRYKLVYKKPQDTEKILNNTAFLKKYNYKVYIPKMLTETTGVIKDVSPKLTEQEIRINAISDKKIISVERIKRKEGDDLVNTRSVKITVEGPELPRVVQIYGVCCKPEIYVYPVRICKKCWRLGHKETACKSKETCLRCGKYITEEHKGCDNSTTAKCKNCGNKHLPTDKNCPERKRRESINAAMMLNKMTFVEAAQLYPKTENRYAILESTDEFPEMERPSRRLTGFRQEVQKQERIDYRKVIDRLMMPKPKPTITKNIFPQAEQIPEQVRTITNNPHAVTEEEKFHTMSNHLNNFFMTLLNYNTEKATDSDPNTDLILIEIGEMINNLMEKLKNKLDNK